MSRRNGVHGPRPRPHWLEKHNSAARCHHLASRHDECGPCGAGRSVERARLLQGGRPHTHGRGIGVTEVAPWGAACTRAGVRLQKQADGHTSPKMAISAMPCARSDAVVRGRHRWRNGWRRPTRSVTWRAGGCVLYNLRRTGRVHDQKTHKIMPVWPDMTGCRHHAARRARARPRRDLWSA